MSVGLNNILQPTKGVWSKSRPCLGGVDVESTFTILDSISRKWGPGELEFEALMRMLDNKVSYTSIMRWGTVDLICSSPCRAIIQGIGTKHSVCWNLELESQEFGTVPRLMIRV